MPHLQQVRFRTSKSLLVPKSRIPFTQDRLKMEVSSGVDRGEAWIRVMHTNMRFANSYKYSICGRHLPIAMNVQSNNRRRQQTPIQHDIHHGRHQSTMGKTKTLHTCVQNENRKTRDHKETTPRLLYIPFYRMHLWKSGRSERKYNTPARNDLNFH